MLVDFLNKLANELALPSLSPPDKNKVYSFLFSDDITLYFQDLSPGTFLYASLKECPKKEREELFLYLMQANLLGEGTGGAAIGMDEEEKYLTLSLSMPYEVNYMEFKEKVEDFINYLLYWREEIEKKEQKAKQTIY